MVIQNGPTLSPLWFQLGGVASALLLLVATPPARGAMLLVPLRAADQGPMLKIAIDQGAQLIGAGPIAGSFVIRADRSRIVPVMLAHGIVTMAAGRAGCGRTGRG